jgi:hypothetical protein
MIKSHLPCGRMGRRTAFQRNHLFWLLAAVGLIAGLVFSLSFPQAVFTANGEISVKLPTTANPDREHVALVKSLTTAIRSDSELLAAVTKIHHPEARNNESLAHPVESNPPSFSLAISLSGSSKTETLHLWSKLIHNIRNEHPRQLKARHQSIQNALESDLASCLTKHEVKSRAYSLQLQSGSYTERQRINQPSHTALELPYVGTNFPGPGSDSMQYHHARKAYQKSLAAVQAAQQRLSAFARNLSVVDTPSLKIAGPWTTEATNK